MIGNSLSIGAVTLLALVINIFVTGIHNTCAATSGGEVKLVSVKKIWDAAPHNAFTDLIRYHDQWYCVFREGQKHVAPDGALRVITSTNGETWQSAALIKSTTGDLRDAKISVTPDGQLMLLGAEALHDKSEHTHQTLTWFSRNGTDWSERHPVGDLDYWLWRVTWNQDTAYGIGYGCGPADRTVRLYRSQDGVKFTTLINDLHIERSPNETSIQFAPDGTAYCLLRRDGAEANGLLGFAEAPYTRWEWKDLGQRIGGPHMLLLPDGRLIGAVRLHQPTVHTALVWLDPVQGTMTECLALPSGGDTSYPGLVWHDDQLWVSYYSSHEQKTSIYLARVAIGPAPPPETVSELPPYPHTNVARTYTVDPTWPARPESVTWAAMPGIAVDAQDQIWTFNRSTPPIQVYRPDGSFVRSWGAETVGLAHHLKIDHDGNIWIADIGLHIVRKFSPEGKVLKTLGTPGVKGCDEAHFNMPTDMAISRQGDVFVSDGYGNNRIVHFDANGNFVKAWGDLGVAPDQFSLPHAIAMDSLGRLYVADRNNVRVQVYDQQAKLLD
ncbi:MAG: hypothetical protein KDA92_17730, partial [Planctomycetales bacterium]|nr:hypothetical protein [Planctomycetales bacterium]